MHIDQDVIDQIIRQADIVDIIGRNLKLRRSGNNYFACCPFHEEKTPSFSINAKEQYYHCFGCGQSGNVINYVMRHNGLDFVEAIKYLANQYSIHIAENMSKLPASQIKAQKIKHITLNETINKIVTYYRNLLNKSSVALNYLTNRGLTRQIIDYFVLGYAPDEYNLLSQLFSDYNSNNFLLDAGMIVKTPEGRVYDRFRYRIIFPIRNVRGEVIAFGGRIIVKGEPKYLNSPETLLFNKSRELYGLYEAQRQIRDKNYAIVVEGYMDVIALFQFKMDNVVATMGTAASSDQIKKLFRLCDDIYYCFDGDSAGHKAAWRALEQSLSLVTDTKSVHFIFLPDEHDPDSFIRTHGVDAFNTQIEKHSISLTGFLLNYLTRLVNLRNDEGKAKLISLVKPYIEQTKAIALSVMMKKQLANLVELEPSVLESILNNRSRYAFYNSKWNKGYVITKRKLPLSLNIIELIISNALHNIELVLGYELPESIEGYSREIQELILVLDFINNNYSKEDVISISIIKDNIEFSSLSLERILALDLVPISAEEFHLLLNKIFGFSKLKVNKCNPIPMKEQL